MNYIERFFSKYPEEKIVNWFRKVCIAEAITCFLLYGVAMIWKRYDEEGFLSTAFIIVIGNLHGLFFTLYLLLCLPARKIFDWDDEDFVFALIAAFFPFATIWIEKKLAKKDRNE
jgi:integral membrane protein